MVKEYRQSRHYLPLLFVLVSMKGTWVVIAAIAAGIAKAKLKPKVNVGKDFIIHSSDNMCIRLANYKKITACHL